MRSIFFKIFVWFWLANVLIVGILLLVIGPAKEPDRNHFRAVSGDMLEMYGRRGLDILREQGPAGYAVYRSSLEQRTGLQLTILDDTGAAGEGDGNASAKMKAIAEHARQTGETQFAQDGDGMLLARPAGLPERDSIFVGRLPGPPAWFFASPSQTLLRVLAAVLMAGLLCYGLAHYLTEPLRRLRRSSRDLAGGNLQTRVGPAVSRRRDEIGDLGRDFNFMAERIESLVSSRQRLILDISHELRSPLTRLNLALGLAVQRAGPELQATLNRMGREAERLNDLIERMLVLARLEHRETAGKPIEVDLAGMLQDIAADAEFEAAAQARAACLVRCDACTLTGIPHLLRSAIENIVRNSLRYTAEHTAVEISLAVESQPRPHAVICVRDHGPGVPNELLDRIFQPFCRVDNDRNRQTGGVGLGLAIASQAIKLHGGTVSAENASDGGLVVEVRLPLAAEAMAVNSPA